MTATIEIKPGWQPLVKARLAEFQAAGHFTPIADDPNRLYVYACQTEAEAQLLARCVNTQAPHQIEVRP